MKEKARDTIYLDEPYKVGSEASAGRGPIERIPFGGGSSPIIDDQL